MSTEHDAAIVAREALDSLIQERDNWRRTASQLNSDVTRQRERLAGQTCYIDGQPIEYWHQIATGTLKTNNELIDRVKALNERINFELDFAKKQRKELAEKLREKERINADLEQQLKSAEIAAEAMGKKYLDQATRYDARTEELIAEKRRANHQKECADKLQSERDAALRELDAMREKIEPVPPEPHYYFFRENSQSRRIQITKEAFVAMRDSAPKIGHSWTVDCMRPNESTLTFYT